MTSDRTTPPGRGRLQLGFSVLAIAVVWTSILPRLATRPAIERRIQLLEERQIDPAACFYSDLECMTEIEQRLAAVRAANPEAFWPGRSARPPSQ